MAAPDAASAWRTSPVGIVGLGLIGGSIALDLRRLGVRVHGLVHRAATAQRALARGLVDQVDTHSDVLAGCGLVVLALPLDRLLNPDPGLLEALPAAAVVTDVGSVKAPVLARWQGLHPRFVASHPMAGTAEAGVDAGQMGLFEDRPWVATPDGSTDPQALAAVEALAGALGARWLCCGAAAHDRAVALISHLPVLVSAALLQAADQASAAGGGGTEPGELASLVRALASSGFADTTRVGGGNPQLGTLMARSNQAAVVAALQAYNHSLASLTQQVQQGNWGELEAALQQAQQLRPQFLAPPPLA
ncbi:MAG: prephenate/arogenate dehydrogenase [Cyanobacteriota bacterium]|nr:prephenate/arogenate dehydrogenase [Cyanobacteriota bacterium]